VNTGDLIPITLLLLLAGAFVTGALVVVFAVRWQRMHRALDRLPGEASLRFEKPAIAAALAPRPSSWLAIRSRSLQAVESALGLHNPKPCTWSESLAGDQKLFIAPPWNGWILVIGSGLPDPADDVDLCFRFLLDLSHKLGQVQFFNANLALGHHAWAQLNSGRVIRAYAWAGQTLWNQGIKTPSELQLGMKCFAYCERPSILPAGFSEIIVANTEKVPLLAAHWSLDPAGIDEQLLEQASGIAGDL